MTRNGSKMLGDSWNRFFIHYSITWNSHLGGGGKTISANESIVSQDLLDVQNRKKKKWKRRCAAVFVEMDRLSCDCDKREKEKKTNAEDHPPSRVLASSKIRVLLIKQFSRVCYVSCTYENIVWWVTRWRIA